MTKSAALTLVVLAAAAILAPGCGTAIKETVGLATGAKGTYLAIQPISADKEDRPLGPYERFELGPLVDDIGGKVPAELLQRLPAEFDLKLKDKKLPNKPAGKTLLIRGKIIHYESSGMVGIALGPLEQVIVRTEFVDKDSGKVLAVANCIGRTTERVNVGVKEKAQGLAKALAGWIDARYPKDKRTND